MSADAENVMPRRFAAIAAALGLTAVFGGSAAVVSQQEGPDAVTASLSPEKQALLDTDDDLFVTVDLASSQITDVTVPEVAGAPGTLSAQERELLNSGSPTIVTMDVDTGEIVSVRAA
ncbi:MULTISPECIES: hypothetical protein [unclassified Nesterenkonia]|uniref:hypothetical protein n=1 Tax=unclassified Nesterenkonia TaxID=2629769 RepID=UPI00111C5633|nr:MULTISPECIES: hypothetical protein [unclassified Nesterenkonia]MDS2173381.1 hypothetical protein [Nesterenkonia sp. CL21]